MTSTSLEVFWRPGCPFCLMLRVGLLVRGIRPRWRNTWQDPTAAEFVRTHNQGNETVPTVRIGDRVLTNPSAQKVRAHLRQRDRS